MRAFIIGGTTGIGLALAKFLLGKGFDVGVCGRDLSKVESSLFEKYENHLQVFQVNALDKELMQSTLKKFIGDQDLHRLYYCAGFYANSRERQLTIDESQGMIDVNVKGALNGIEIATDIMQTQGFGTIVTVSSMAGVFSDSIYALTKAALIDLSIAYRRALAPFGITVLTVAPGYVDTAKLRELNGGDLKDKLFVVTEEFAASEIEKAIEENIEVHIFPRQMKWIANTLKVLPESARNFILNRRN